MIAITPSKLVYDHLAVGLWSQLRMRLHCNALLHRTTWYFTSTTDTGRSSRRVIWYRIVHATCARRAKILWMNRCALIVALTNECVYGCSWEARALVGSQLVCGSAVVLHRVSRILLLLMLAIRKVYLILMVLVILKSYVLSITLVPFLYRSCERHCCSCQPVLLVL